MVMNRRHFEHTLTVSDFEIADLNNITHSFANINNTDWKQYNRAFAHIAESYNHSAEESEPVSPINVLAGFQFQQRKPKTPPKRAPEKIVRPAKP